MSEINASLNAATTIIQTAKSEIGTVCNSTNATTQNTSTSNNTNAENNQSSSNTETETTEG